MLLLRTNAILNESYVSMRMSRRCCFFMLLRFMLHAVYRIFKPYLRTLGIEHRIYRRKQNLLNLPYSPIITICSLSTVVTCVKRSQIWSNGYCLCNMFHVFLFVFLFLFVSSFQLNFNFFNYQPWNRILSVTMFCVVMTSVFSWYFTMEWNADWVLRVYVEFCVCVCEISFPIGTLSCYNEAAFWHNPPLSIVCPAYV